MRCEIKYSLDVYLLADAVSMVAMGITVSGEAEVEIPEIDFFFFECFVFLVISIFVWLYMLIDQKTVSEFGTLSRRYCFARSFRNF